MTPQPLVSCCWARVAYLPVSPWAFWMSVSKPASLNAASRAGRSPFSHRLEEAASGRITQARFWAALPPEAELSPLSPLEHAARMRTLTVASAATPDFLRFTATSAFSEGGAKVCFARSWCALRHSRAVGGSADNDG